MDGRRGVIKSKEGRCMRPHFNLQLSKGLKSEARVIEIISDAGFKITHRGANHRHDVCVVAPSGLVFRVEVKNEDAYADSGNILVELRQGSPPKPSGLSSSESTICVHTLGDAAALYRSQEMRIYLSASLIAKNVSYSNLGVFGKSDNNNRGVKVRRGMLDGWPWYDELPLEDVAKSKLWRF